MCFATVLGRIFSAIQINLGCIYLFEVCQVTGHWNWCCWVLWYFTWNNLCAALSGFVSSRSCGHLSCLCWTLGSLIKISSRALAAHLLYSLILIVFLLYSNGSLTFLLFQFFLSCQVVLLFLCDRFQWYFVCVCG